jgi:hypothetical protein
MLKPKFGLLPGHWGLAGKTRERAKAEYELSGYDRAVRLLEIDEDEYTPDEYSRKLLDLKRTYNKISPSEWDRAVVALIRSDKQRALATLELDNKDGKIVGSEYDKQLATLKGEPWVNVVNMDFTKKSSLEGSFELDWNEPFVEKLKSEGYSGPSPDNIVNQWFMELCRNIAMEEFDGTGDFTADSEANLEAVKRWSSDSESLGKGRKGYT